MREIFNALAKSKFRLKFKLSQKEKEYVKNKGLDVVRVHAYDILSKRIAPADIPNDGKQTPYKNHPVFIAQHATAICCRKCISKWHKIPAGIELEKEKLEYLVDIIMQWIEGQLD